MRLLGVVTCLTVFIAGACSSSRIQAIEAPPFLETIADTTGSAPGDVVSKAVAADNGLARMPSLIGLSSVSAARDQLAATCGSGMLSSARAWDPANPVPNGKIVHQIPEAGMLLATGALCTPVDAFSYEAVEITAGDVKALASVIGATTLVVKTVGSFATLVEGDVVCRTADPIIGGTTFWFRSRWHMTRGAPKPTA